jgi:hypothetical protein
MLRIPSVFAVLSARASDGFAENSRHRHLSERRAVTPTCR